MLEWKDETSYSRGGDRVPRVWTAHAGCFRVSVHRHIDYEPDEWLVSTVPAVFDNEPLASKEVEAAKVQALAKLQVELQRGLNDILKGGE